MKTLCILTILCALTPAIAAAQDGRAKTEPAQRARRIPAPGDIVAPGVLRQDLFDRNNPNNLRRDYPAAPAQPAQF
jgi:hypothetical protein